MEFSTPLFFFLDTKDIINFYFGGVGDRFGITCFNYRICLPFFLCLCSYFYSFCFGLRVLGCLNFVSCFRVVLGSMCE